jgi:CRISPR system Cascade subunit CasB
MSITFEADKPLGQALQKWWEELQLRNADRAELRRAESVAEIILLPAFQRVCIRFKPFFQHEKNWEDRFAAITGLLAHVRSTTRDTLAYTMSGNPKPVVSELRFRRLIQRDRNELFISMIRVLRMLDGKANLHDLAHSVYYWGDPVKRDWAFTYFPNTPDKLSA